MKPVHNLFMMLVCFSSWIRGEADVFINKINENGLTLHVIKKKTKRGNKWQREKQCLVNKLRNWKRKSISSRLTDKIYNFYLARWKEVSWQEQENHQKQQVKQNTPQNLIEMLRMCGTFSEVMPSSKHHILFQMDHCRI